LGQLKVTKSLLIQQVSYLSGELIGADLRQILRRASIYAM